jgi:CHASE2 domain-containing sensor protein
MTTPADDVATISSSDMPQVRMRRLVRRNGPALIIALVALAAIFGLKRLGYLTFFEFSVYDWALNRRTADADHPDWLTLILLPGGNQISDHKLIELLERIENKATVIGIDVWRPDATPDPSRPGKGDSDFKELVLLINTSPNIITAEYLAPIDRPQDEILPPAGVNTQKVGFANGVQDGRNIVRRYVLYEQGHSPAHFSLGFRVAQIFAYNMKTPGVMKPAMVGSEPVFVFGPEGMERKVRRLHRFDGGYSNPAVEQGFQVLLDYRERSGAFKTITVEEALGKNPPIEDRAVLIGYDQGDDQTTPLHGAQGSMYDTMHGVEVHAHAISQLIRMAQGESPATKVLSQRAEWSLSLVLALLGGLIGTSISNWRSWAMVAVAGSVAIAIGWYSMFAVDLWMPLVPLMLSFLTPSFVARIFSSHRLVVFISYARMDTALVLEVYRCLRAAGHDLRIDKLSLEPGSSYPEQLARQIRTADRLLLCFSEKSVGRLDDPDAQGEVWPRELKAALDTWQLRLDNYHRNQPDPYLVPVRLNSCSVPTQISSLHCIDFFGPGGCRRLRTALRSHRAIG